MPNQLYEKNLSLTKGSLSKNARRITSGVLAILSAMTIQTSAKAATLQQQTIEVKQGIDMYYNNSYFIPQDAKGNKVESFVYNGTTYVPARALSNLFGYAISWNGQDKSVHIDLTNKIESSAMFGAPEDKTPYMTTVNAQTGITLYVKDETGENQVIPRNVNGKEVPIIKIGGTNYLPVRAISNIFGQDIAWNKDFQGVAIGKYEAPIDTNTNTNTNININSSTKTKDPTLWQAYLNYLKYLDLLKPYMPTVHERVSTVNDILNDGGIIDELEESDLQDPVLYELYANYLKIIRPLVVLQVELDNTKMDNKLQERQPMFQHVIDGTYTTFEHDVIIQESNDYKNKCERLDSLLKQVSDAELEKYKVQIQDATIKFKNYMNQKKLVLR